MNNLYIEMVKNAKVNPKTHRCEFCDSDGQAIHIFPDGKNELEPHLYKPSEAYRNVNVTIDVCPKCGAVNINWTRTSDTVDVSEEYRKTGFLPDDEEEK